MLRSFSLILVGTSAAVMTAALPTPSTASATTAAASAPVAAVVAVDTYTGLSLTVPAGLDDQGRPQSCHIDADLYKPHGASTTNRVPTILTTNGFGGSKADQAGLGRAFAERGYAVLSYTGPGFPQWRAGSGRHTIRRSCQRAGREPQPEWIRGSTHWCP